ncbi:hypothetical protein CC80DRAFT_25651 [Byssothecium circinans]|uniref:F-box domain-containing protein n=1 Tax=Byssothecium circinans TaxID=147558 RepID=A0A6A5U0M4_9PLEO|nr:hypothetical protein CC80DRAFT_25651 [Byssothecium circinans]
MSSPIERLPVELTDFIIAHFSLPEYQNFRLVSRLLHHVTLSSFHNRYFARRTTTLTSSCLDRLLKVSACRHLAGHVSLLSIKVLNNEEIDLLRDIHRVGIYPPPKRFPKITQVKPADISHEVACFDRLLAGDDPKDAIDKLSRAMRRLTNLKSIRLFVNDKTLSNKPYYVAGELPCDDFEVASLTFKAVLAALLKSDIQIERFQTVKGTHIRKKTRSASIIYTAFQFPLDRIVSLGNAFSSLRVLVLALRTSYSGDSRVPGWQNHISHFIGAAAALEELTLCFQPEDRASRHRAAVMQSIACSVQVPNLKLFHLWGGAFRADDMTLFMKNHSSSLRQLHIRQCFLREGKWHDFINSLRESRLEYLRLAKVTYRSGGLKDVQWLDRDTGDMKDRILLDASHEEGWTMDEMLIDCVDRIDVSHEHEALQH